MFFNRKGANAAPAKASKPAAEPAAKPAKKKAAEKKAAKDKAAKDKAETKAKSPTGAKTKDPKKGKKGKTGKDAKGPKTGKADPKAVKQSKVGKADPKASANKTDKKAAAEAKKKEDAKKDPKTIRIDIAIDPSAAEAKDDKFTLMSATDGGKAYKQTKSVKDDKVAGDKNVTLEFTDAPDNLMYSLEIDPGKEGEKYFEFTNVPFSHLVG